MSAPVWFYPHPRSPLFPSPICGQLQPAPSALPPTASCVSHADLNLISWRALAMHPLTFVTEPFARLTAFSHQLCVNKEEVFKEMHMEICFLFAHKSHKYSFYHKF